MNAVGDLSNSHCGNLEELNDRMRSLLCLCDDVNECAQSCLRYGVDIGLGDRSYVEQTEKLYDKLTVFVIQASDVARDIKEVFNIVPVVLAVDKLESSLEQIRNIYKSREDSVGVLLFYRDGLFAFYKFFLEIGKCSETVLMNSLIKARLP